MSNCNLQITDSAWDHIAQIIKNAPEPVKGFRAEIKGGGCSGFQYNFAYAYEIDEDDIVIENNNVRVVVDPISMVYMNDAVIGWEDGFASSGFIMNNPNVQSTCGCGNSFSPF